MGFLSDLKTATPANAANAANRKDSSRPDSHDSQDSQGVAPEKSPPLTDRQREAVAILRADPTLRRAFAGEPTESGYRLAVALRKFDGRIVAGELILPQAPDLPGLAEAMADTESRQGSDRG